MNKIIAVLLFVLFLIGCGAELDEETIPRQVVSSLSADDCFLCGNGAEEPFYWGQNNVGIISLNTFETMIVEINRYNEHGVRIEKSAGYIRTEGFQNSENGFWAYMMVDPDRGYAIGKISFLDDEELKAEKTATFLCQDCLDAVQSEIYKKGLGVGVINFATREIRAFEPDLTGFCLGDYYVHICDWEEWNEKKDTQEIEFQVCYHPPRYGGAGNVPQYGQDLSGSCRK